ncbi:MAG TPA: peptide ABC transporter substrate-binding protein [Chloroflexota bacterium]|nr:peptide ABC transporter substrate-binding protein [Chloroflexota bacterium]
MPGTTSTRRAVAVGVGAAALAGCTLSLPGDSRASRLGPLAERQVLRLALDGDPETLDPARVSFVDEIAVVMRVHSNLLAFDARGALVPELAERLPAVSPDGKRLTFALRPGLVYSDGAPLRASDFSFSWQRHVTPPSAGPYAHVGQVVESVRAVDDRTVEFALTEPAPWFLSVLTTWCGVPLREDVVARAGWTEPPHYVGCGPFVLTLRERQNRLLLAANPRYYQGPPTLAAVELSQLGDPATALSAYRNDELDVHTIRGEDLSVVQQDQALRRQLQQFPGTCTTFLSFNTTRAPYSLLGVRRAIATALDRAAYVSGPLGGLGTPATQLVPPGMPGHYRQLAGQRRDLTAARKHLADAGYADPSRLPPLQVTYAGGARARVRAEALATQLREALAIAASAEPAESRAFSEAIRSPAAAPGAFVTGWCQDYPDPQAWYSALFHSRSALSGTGWSSVDVDRMLDEANAERAPRRRDELYQRAAQRIADEAPVVFLYHETVSRLVKPWVHGLAPNPLELYEGQANTMGLRILKH